MKILIVKTSSMGDIIHTLPSLTDASEIIGNISFDWVVEEEFIEIPFWHETVDEIIPLAIRRWRKTWFSKITNIERKSFKQKIISKHYDIIIDAQGLLKSAIFVTSLTKGIKHGLNWYSARESLSSLFYDYKHNINKKQHVIEFNRDLFAKSLGYTKPKTQGKYNIIQYFKKFTLKDNMPYIIFFHSTTKNNKHWPEINWYKLIELIKPYNIYVKLPWNLLQEKLRAERLAANFEHVSILPKLSLTQIAEKILMARAVISVDTGLSHLASALNKFNITLFGPTNPDLVSGYGKNQYKIASKTKKMVDIDAYNVFLILKEKNII